MQGGIIAPRSLDMLAAPWLCTMLMVYLLVGKKRSCSRLLEPGGHAKECSEKCQMVSVGSWAQSKIDGCAWDILRLHDRVFIFLLEVPVPASEVVASVVRHTA